MKIQANEKYKMVNLLIQSALNQVRFSQHFTDKIQKGDVPDWVKERLDNKKYEIEWDIKSIEESCLLGLEDYCNLVNIKRDLSAICDALEGSHSGLHDDDYFDGIRDTISKATDLIYYLIAILESSAKQIKSKKTRTKSE